MQVFSFQNLANSNKTSKEQLAQVTLTDNKFVHQHVVNQGLAQ